MLSTNDINQHISYVLHYLCHFLFCHYKLHCRSHNNDVVSKICTPSPSSAMNTTNDATRTDDAVPNPTIEATTGDDSLSNDDEKMPATNPKNDDSSQGIAMPSLKEAAALFGCKKCQEELDSGIKTKYAHDSKCPRKWHSKGGCPKRQAKISASRHTDGTADEKDANVTHHMKGNGDNDNKGKALRFIRMNEKGTGEDDEDG